MTFVPTSIASACAHNGRASRARARQQGIASASHAFEVSIAFKLCHQHVASSRKVASLKQHCALRPLVDDCASTVSTHTRKGCARRVQLTVVCVNEQHVAFCDAASATARASAQPLRAHKGTGVDSACARTCATLQPPLAAAARARERARARARLERRPSAHPQERSRVRRRAGAARDTRGPCLEPRTAGGHGHPRWAAQHGLRPRCFRLLLRARPRRLNHGLRKRSAQCVLGTKAASHAFSIFSKELCRFTDRLPARPVRRRGAAAPGCGCAGDAAPSLRTHRGAGPQRDITAAARREPTAGYQRRAAQLARSSAARARLVQQPT
jgi:hypothetical protein